MDEGLLTDEKLRNSYLTLKKISDQIKKDYNRFMSEDFSDQDWRYEGRKISGNIQKFEKLFEEVEQNLEQAKDEDNFDSSTIQTVEEGLKSIKSVQGQIRAMKDKISSANYNLELADKMKKKINNKDK